MLISCIQILSTTELYHYGIKGMKWGIRRTPEQLGHNKKVAKILNHDNIIAEAIYSGEVLKTISHKDQWKHNLTTHLSGRSYIYGDDEYAQELVNRLSGTGKAIVVDGKWKHKERVSSPEIIGKYVDNNGVAVESKAAMIIYSKTGTHIYPRREEDDND